MSKNNSFLPTMFRPKQKLIYTTMLKNNSVSIWLHLYFPKQIRKISRLFSTKPISSMKFVNQVSFKQILYDKNSRNNSKQV